MTDPTPQTTATMHVTLPATSDRWVLLEVMGHRAHVGRLREVAQFGVSMAQIEVICSDCGAIGGPRHTHLYAGSAIFSVTDLADEADARKRAREHYGQKCEPCRLRGLARPALPAIREEEDAESDGEVGGDNQPCEACAGLQEALDIAQRAIDRRDTRRDQLVNALNGARYTGNFDEVWRVLDAQSPAMKDDAETASRRCGECGNLAAHRLGCGRDFSFPRAARDDAERDATSADAITGQGECGAGKPGTCIECTRPEHHAGDHVAADSDDRIIARWSLLVPEIVARLCTHTGVGLPGCKTCDPRTASDGGPRPDAPPSDDDHMMDIGTPPPAPATTDQWTTHRDACETCSGPGLCETGKKLFDSEMPF